MPKREDPTPHLLLDTIIKTHGLKNDAALCRMLKLGPPAISKIRNGVNPLSPEVVLRIYDTSGMSIERIRELAPTPEPAAQTAGA